MSEKMEIESGQVKIAVIGVGGAANNVVNKMAEENIKGVDFIAIDTDQQVLEASKLPAGIDMVFVICGTESDADVASAVAEIFKKLGILTIGVTVNALSFESIGRFKNNTDTLIVVPDERLLYQGVRSLTDPLQGHDSGLIGWEFSDILSATKNKKGIAHIGIGHGNGENNAVDAIKQAMKSPLLENTISDATDMFVTFAAKPGSISMLDISNAVECLNEAAGEDVDVILGAVNHESLDDEVIVTIFANGIERTAKNA